MAQSYSITDLGDLDGYYSEAHGLNDSGWVVGEYEPTNALYQHAFVYDSTASREITGLGSGQYAIAYGINDSNVIVGEYAPNDPLIIQAFAYSNGVVTDLGSLAGNYSSAHAINRGGQAVGESTTNFTVVGNAVVHAVLYSRGSKTDLGALGGDYSSANGINNNGLIVGESDVLSGSAPAITNIHAFIYTSAMRDLGTLGGNYSSAKAINDAGVVVGESDAVSAGVTNLHAFVYQNGTMRDLGALDADSSSASAINQAGQIVGYLGYGTGNNQLLKACLFSGSNIVVLNDLIPPDSGWTNLATADGINDQGQITGSGSLANGEYHAFLLTPSQPWIRLTSPMPIPGVGFQVTVESLPGQRFVFQATTNVASAADWESLSTNVLVGAQTNLIDTAATGGNSRFYRAVLLP